MTAPAPGEQHDGHSDEQQPRDRTRLKHAVRLAIAVVAALISLYWLSRYADIGTIVPLVQASHRSTLLGAVALLLASLAAKSMRWHALLPSGSPLSRVEAFQIFHVSVLLNNLLPFRAGDSVRILSPAVRRSVSARHAILILLAERLVDGIALAGVASFVLPMAGPRLMGRLPYPGATFTLVMMVLVAAVISGMVAWTASSGIRRHIRWWALVARSGLAGMGEYQRPQARRIALLTVLAWVGTFWLHYLLMGAVGVSGSLLLATVVTLSTNISMLVPATPANIGVFHAAAAAPLIAFGAPADLSVAYAVLVHAVNTVPPMAVGALCLVIPLARARMPSIIARPRG